MEEALAISLKTGLAYQSGPTFNMRLYLGFEAAEPAPEMLDQTLKGVYNICAQIQTSGATPPSFSFHTFAALWVLIDHWQPV